MSTSLCGKRKRCSSPETETEIVIKKLNTIHISIDSSLSGAKRKYEVDDLYPIINTLPVKRRRDTLDIIEESGPTVRELYTCDRQGRKQGKYESWYHNGQRCELSQYIDGKEEGMTQHWYADGKPYAIYNMCYGLKEGLAYTWFQNGMMKTVEHYMSGLLNGTVTHFSEGGNKIHESIFEFGELKNEIFWNTDGDMVYKDMY